MNFDKYCTPIFMHVFLYREATSSDTNVVKVTGATDSGCWSSVGMNGGEQRLQLNPNGCMSSG